MLLGHSIDGGGIGRTSTVNVQLLLFPQLSSAVHTTGVMPQGKKEPDGGTQVMDATPLPPGSAAVGGG
jgi:hypothetical protein